MTRGAGLKASPDGERARPPACCICGPRPRRTTAPARWRSGGAPHGTLVATGEQRGGRAPGSTWSAPPGRALLLSLVLRDPPGLLPLTAGLAVAQAAGSRPRSTGPTTSLSRAARSRASSPRPAPAKGGRSWASGSTSPLRVDDLPPELHATAGTLGLTPADLEPTLERLLAALQRALALEDSALLGPTAPAMRCGARGRVVRGTRDSCGNRRRRAARRRIGRRRAHRVDAGEVIWCAERAARGLGTASSSEREAAGAWGRGSSSSVVRALVHEASVFRNGRLQTPRGWAPSTGLSVSREPTPSGRAEGVAERAATRRLRGAARRGTLPFPR